MITQKVIDTLYKTYKKRPASADELDIGLLFEIPVEYHDIEIDDNANLLINSLPQVSPFRKLALSRINAIVEFENKVAIVLRSSIIFLNKNDNKSYIHIREEKMSLVDRIFNRIKNDEDEKPL